MQAFLQASRFQLPQVKRSRLVVTDLDNVDTWQFAVREEEFGNSPHVVWHQETENAGTLYEVETEADALQFLRYLKSVGESGIYYQNGGPSKLKV